MKYFPLIWAGLWRKPVRTTLTMLSLVFAFMLFGMLRSVDAGFDNLIAHSEEDRIFVFPRFFPQTLPLAYVDQIAKIEGVTEVGYQTFINGYYRDPKTFHFVGGANAGLMHIYDEVDFSKEALEALKAKPNGILISPWMADHLGGAKIGDHVPLHSNDRMKDGSQDWDFEVVGFVDRKDSPGIFSFSFGNFDYVNEARAEPRNTVIQIGVRVADPEKGLQTARAIDAMFLNSGTATRSSTDRINFESGLSSFGNIKLIVNGIMSAVLLVLLLLTATTLAQSVDERLGEFAVLKTLGFTDQAVSGFIIFESLVQCALGAAFGLLASTFVAPLMQGKLPGPPVFFRVPAFVYVLGAVTAVVIALAAAAIPAARARRLQIVDALAKR
ncbi:MAG: ABC transporter permease [Rhodospirillaceae bacterium]